jgi:broad-specificity NMP kinase
MIPQRAKRAAFFAGRISACGAPGVKTTICRMVNEFDKNVIIRARWASEQASPAEIYPSQP